jgi:hypothetical protein
MTWLRIAVWAFMVCGVLLLGCILFVEQQKTLPLPVSQESPEGRKNVWTLPDISGVYYGSKMPLLPGDCVRVTATRTLEKVDVCQMEEAP